MALQTPHDIPLLITVPGDTPSSKPLVSAERRITPTWTISELRTKLEPITGIPASSQSLRTKSLSGSWISLQPDTALVGDHTFGLFKDSEIEVLDGRPPGMRTRFDDVNSVEKYVMPEEKYEKLNDSVLAWKRNQKLGRFDPNAKSPEQLIGEKRSHDLDQIKQKDIKVGLRCRVHGSDERRGAVRYVGEIAGLGGDRERGCVWVGVEFDEPVGKNDGSATVEVIGEDGKKGTEKRRIFDTKGPSHGGFVRPEVVEVGQEYGMIDDLADLMDEDMEEI